MPSINGNKMKGNSQKKGGRTKKEIYTDFDPTTDRYGKILNLIGGKHVSVLLLNDTDNKPICANIRGIHHKKVWFRKDDLVVVRGTGNIVEIWGKVSEEEYNDIKRKFDLKENKGNTDNLIFQENDNESDSDSDSDVENNVVLKQPERNFNINEEIDDL